MKRLCTCLLSLALTCPITVLAQQGSDPVAALASSAPAESKQFDFLLGQWQVEVHPKISSLVAMIHGTPRLVGTWKAWRTADGVGVEDELRIVDGSGNPISLNRSQRSYAKAEGHWKIRADDTTHGRTSEATGQWAGGEMRVEGHFTEAGKSTTTRTRYYEITADSFRMQQDRSTDGGKTWDEGALTIEAKRVAASATP